LIPILELLGIPMDWLVPIWKVAIS